MSDPVEEKALEEYLRRKSALSMGYKRLYVDDSPPPELDRAITARARRALRWLIPGVLAVGIAVTLVLGIQFGVNSWMKAMVAAEKNVEKIRQEQKAELERKRAEQPISVIIDAKDIPTEVEKEVIVQRKIEHDKWLAEIEQLRREGKNTRADAEMKRFKAVFPDEEK